MENVLELTRVQATESAPLFSFGTLMDMDVLSIVSGQRASELSIVPVTVPGFAQHAVIAQDFPVLVPDPAASTTGVIIAGLTDVALDRILFFEGDEYALADISVSGDGGRTIACKYFKDTAVYEISDAAWNFEQWRVSQKADFLVRTERFMQLYGTMSATEADLFW